MASLINRRGLWYSRVIIYLGDKKQKEIQIPLKTKSLTIARTRCEKVGNQEKNIKDGILQKFQFKSKFKWLNDAGTSEYKSLTLGDISRNIWNIGSV